MPGRPSRPCTYPGCGVLTNGKRARCEKHVEKPWVKSGPQIERIRGETLQNLRRQLFREQPLCQHCLLVGRTTLATQRDHIIPLEEGGQDTKENTQALCQECHDVKSKAERERGLARSRPTSSGWKR